MNGISDCLIVGGGVIGLAMARRLAMDGARVRLLERGDCGREASWAGAGILAPCNPHRKDVLARFQDLSLEMYAPFCASLLDDTGIDPEYDACGELDLLLTNDAVPIARSDVAAGAGRTAPGGLAAFELLDVEQTRQLEPCISDQVLGAMHSRVTAKVRNPRLLSALVASCRKRGVDVREHESVTGLLMTGSRVTGVETASGPMNANCMILAAGAWSSQIDPRLQVVMPVYPVRGQMVLLKLDRPLFCHVVSRGRTYLVARRDGHVLLGSTEEPEAGFVKRNTARAIAQLIGTAVKLVPSIENAPVVGTWSGLRPGTSDDMPYLGAVPGFEGLIAATGHFRAGLTLAPATADYISALVQGKPYELDLRCCLPGRLMAT